MNFLCSCGFSFFACFWDDFSSYYVSMKIENFRSLLKDFENKFKKMLKIRKIMQDQHLVKTKLKPHN